MQTVVLAAGEGQRMHPLTASRAKPMLPVAARPLVAHVLDAAAAAGASRFVVVVGEGGDGIREYVGGRWDGVPVDYEVQSPPRGTADAVQAARPALSDGQFAVLNGDVLYDVESVGRLYGNGPAVASHRVEDPTAYGVLRTDGERVTGVVEKPADPPGDLVNAGAYVFPAEALGWLDVARSERGELELTDVLERTCRGYDVDHVPVERWMDVGRPWELLAANEWKVGERSRAVRGEVHADADLVGDVVVEAGATVEAGVVVEGPAVIREGATVGPNAYVRGATLVGRGARVGHAAEVKNSVLMRDARVPHLSYVGDSVLGPSVNFGAGTTVANLRHDGEDVKLTVKGERVSTGRRKFGVVAGPGAKTAIDTSIDAGVVLSPGARTAPGESVTRDR